MLQRTLLVASIAMLLAACGQSPTPAGPRLAAGAQAAARTAIAGKAIADTWLVGLKAGDTPAAYARRHSLRHAGAIGLKIHRFIGPVAIASLSADARFAEPDRELVLPADTSRAYTPFPAIRADGPSDPLIPAQYARAITGLDRAYPIEKGRPEVVVAVIDSGVDASHPEFEGQLLPGWDVTVTPPRAGGHTDGYGHGTHVAGVVAAKADNGQGIAGAAPGVKILPVRIFNDFGHSSDGASAAAVIWAVDHGAKVINASWGSPMPGEAATAAYQYALSKDVVFVAAVGNSGKNDTEYFPGASEGVIGVSATNDIDGWGSFSTFGDWVDVAAPGEGILSTYPLSKGNGYRIMRGTSMAAPLVSGLAALIRSRFPELTQAQVKARLEATAKDVIMNGKDPYAGHGRVDAYRALMDPLRR